MNDHKADVVKSKVINVKEAKSFEGSDENGNKYCISVMVSSKDSDGAWTYTHDTYEKNFVVDLHYHNKHDEIFSILEGEMEWTVGDSKYVAKPGTVLWVPKGTPHGFHAFTYCRMNMFYNPGGYEITGEKYAQLTLEDKKNETLMKKMREEHDLVLV